MLGVWTYIVGLWAYILGVLTYASPKKRIGYSSIAHGEACMKPHKKSKIISRNKVPAHEADIT